MWYLDHTLFWMVVKFMINWWSLHIDFLLIFSPIDYLILDTLLELPPFEYCPVFGNEGESQHIIFKFSIMFTILEVLYNLYSAVKSLTILNQKKGGVVISIFLATIYSTGHHSRATVLDILDDSYYRHCLFMTWVFIRMTMHWYNIA